MVGEADFAADAEEAQSQGADVWRTLEALLRIAGSEFSLRDSCIFKQAFPETYYTMVRTSGIESAFYLGYVWVHEVNFGGVRLERCSSFWARCGSG